MKIPSDASALWKTLYVAVGGVFPLICRLHVTGTENIPASGGCIITCNHTAGPDWLFLGYAATRQVNYMAKAEIFGWNPLLANFLKSAGVFPIRRGQGDMGAIQFAVEIIKSGRVLGMFPEGTRSYTGELKQGKTGAVRIAMQSKAPIVPCAVVNSNEALRKLGRPWLRPDVYVSFGPPLYFEGDSANREPAQQGTERVMLATAALLPAALRGEWGKQLAG